MTTTLRDHNAQPAFDSSNATSARQGLTICGSTTSATNPDLGAPSMLRWCSTRLAEALWSGRWKPIRAPNWCSMPLGQRRSAAVIHYSDHGCQGRFKRSSQHLDRGNWDDYWHAPLGSIRATAL